jgi:predicted site-specific integrase-resolvase
MSGWIKLSEWARREGVSRRTANRMFHRGTIPHPVRQLDTGTIQVRVLDEADEKKPGLEERLRELERRVRTLERRPVCSCSD